VRQFIAGAFGDEYVPEKPNVFKTKSDAQDAHEAIRPTSMQYHPDEVRAQLTHDQYYLYKLIWNRFVASQMPPATFDETTVDITAAAYLFRVKGSVPKFPGWMAVYNQPVAPAPDIETVAPGPDARTAEDDEDSSVLPPLAQGDTLTLRELKPEQKFTQPPPRYTEATLVKALEENGIGRPSTYASIITVIQAREYVNKIEGKFKPTVLGVMLVEKLLSPAFDDILDVGYTRELEEDLDKIESGASDYESTLTSFYKKFSKDLKRAAKEMINLKEGVEPDPPVACDKCAKPMVIKAGKFGLFLACSGYPECENTRELETPEAAADGRGARGDVRELRQADGRQARPLRPVPRLHRLSECKTTRKIIATKQGITAAKPDQILEEKCPKCGSNLVVKQGRFGEFTGVQQLSDLQVREAEDDRRPLPEGRRRHRRAQVAAREGVLRLRELSRLRLHAVESSVAEKCPDCGAPFLVEKITKKHGRQLVCNNEDCSYARQAEELTTA
jgi:DNA topoisomerase-1